MNGTTMPSRVWMEKEALENLTAELKETLANEHHVYSKQAHSLKVIDVWNIQRKHKPAGSLFRGRPGWMQ